MSFPDHNPGSPGGFVESQRLFDAPRPVVFRAFSDPAVLARWWGPDGFTNTFHEFDFRPGGAWRFLMRGPDGSEFEMDKRFVEIAPPDRITLEHLGPIHRFLMTATFTEEGSGTRVSWRMEFESAADLEPIRPFLLEANEQNFDRLAECLEDL
jgi:uncharacterized protein YndB with AHSA1/START domain